jgi:ribonuclease-3
VLGEGATRSGERKRDSVLASLFEAVIAAIFLECGLIRTRRFVLDAIKPELEAAGGVTRLKAPKSRLQEHAYRRSGHPPMYRLVSAEGPDHRRHYVVEVSLDGQALGRGEGPNRRVAETEAATTALVHLESVDEQPGVRRKAVGRRP